jgi:hypothetical protein
MFPAFAACHPELPNGCAACAAILVFRIEDNVNPIKKSIPYGRHTLTLETGEIARQSGGAAMVSLDDTVVLVTAVARTRPRPARTSFR